MASWRDYFSFTLYSIFLVPSFFKSFNLYIFLVKVIIQDEDLAYRLTVVVVCSTIVGKDVCVFMRERDRAYITFGYFFLSLFSPFSFFFFLFHWISLESEWMIFRTFSNGLLCLVAACLMTLVHIKDVAWLAWSFAPSPQLHLFTLLSIYSRFYSKIPFPLF